MIKTSKQTSWLSKQQSIAWGKEKVEKRKLPVSKNTMFYFSFDLVPQLEPKTDLQEGEFTFQGTFCSRRRPSRVSSLYIYLYVTPCKEILILESGKFMLVESGIPEKIGIWNPES